MRSTRSDHRVGRDVGVGDHQQLAILAPQVLMV
jgi:hypothetical protein